MLSLSLSVLLLGCQTTPSKDSAATAEAPKQPEVAAEIPRTEPPRPKIDLSEDILYKVMVAEVAGQRGHLDISVENYLELARATRDPKVVERATRIAVYARNTEAAAEAAQLWAQLDPGNPDPHQILAVMSLRQKNVEETLVHLEQILKSTAGEFRQKLWMIVNMLGRERDRDLVMTVMERLLSDHQDEVDAIYAFADIASRMGDLNRSLELLTKAHAMAPDNDDVALSYINILQRMERTNDAITWLEEVLAKRDSNDFNLRLAYARLLYSAQRFDDARRQFEILVVAAPNNPDVLYWLGNLYLQTNRIDDAELYFKRLVDQDSRFHNAKYLLGRIAEERKDYATASVWYESVQSGDYAFDAQVRYGLLLGKRKSTEAALTQLQSIDTSNQAQENVLTEAIAELLTGEQRYADAMAVYDKALENRYDADLLYSRAMLAEKMDMLDLAEEDLRLILTKEPQHAQALNALGYTLADRTNRYQEAYELIQKALTLEPKSYYFLDSMGWVLYRMGKHEEAIDYLRKAMALTQDPEIAAHLGEVLWVAGDKKGAQQVWETALKNTPEHTKLIDVMKRFTPIDNPR
ncbi:MAG: Tetratricopeptide TPR 2 repeat protein [Gammaproteobacteria bacterium]|nr:Tetratricopeptide TPR 2 repeat protein [Gammaproteobacteria bacterium]